MYRGRNSGGVAVILAGVAAAMVIATWVPAITQEIGADRVLGQTDFDTATPRAGAGGLAGPLAIAIDRSSSPAHLYVADTANNRVLGYRDAESFANGAPAEIVIGEPDFAAAACNRTGVADATTLCLPSGVAVDSIGNLYVADAGNNRVLEYDDPFAIFEQTGQDSGFSANRVVGQGDFSATACNRGRNAAGADTSCIPSGLAIDELDRLYLTDSGNNRALRFDDPLSQPIADLVIGQPDFSGFRCNQGASAPTAASLCSPQGIAVDSEGNLYVADESNNRVIEYDTPSDSGPVGDMVFGQTGFNSAAPAGCAGRASSANGLCLPRGVALDADGNLFVADSGNSRVLEYLDAIGPDPGAASAPGNPGDTAADAVYGHRGIFTASAGNGGGINASSLSFAAGIAVDESGGLYIADTGNNRVVEYSRAFSPALELATVDRAQPQSGPAIAAAPRHLNFGRVVFFDASDFGSATRRVTLANSTAADITESLAIAPGSADAGDFTPTDAATPKQCNGTVPAHKKCPISVTFSPTGTGTRTALLDIQDSSGNTLSTIKLAGKAFSGAIGVAPKSLNFGKVHIGQTSRSKGIRLSSRYRVPIGVSGIAVVGPDGVTPNNDYSVDITACGGAAPFNVVAKQRPPCLLVLRFSPSVSGPDNGTLIVSDDAAGGEQKVALKGRGTGVPAGATPGSTPSPGVGSATVSIEPSVISFGDELVGNTSNPQTITVTNSQQNPLNISAIIVNNSQFTETDDCISNSPIAPFGACTITVTFAPVNGGAQVASLTIQDDFASLLPQSVELIGIGTGVAPTPGPTSTASPPPGSEQPPTLLPLSVSFGPVPVGGSATQNVTLTNNQSGPLNISGITISNSAFTETDNCSSVAPFGKCTIGITFAPAARGAETGILTVDDGFADTPLSPQSVQLIGVGTSSVPSPDATPTSAGGGPPPLPPTLSPLVLSFAALPVGNTSVGQTVKVTNNSNGPLSVSGITISNSEFAETDNCTPSVAAFGTCTIGVTFTPAAGGSQTGTLTLDDGFTDTPISPQSVELIGVGDAVSAGSPSATGTPVSGGPPPIPPTLSPLVLSFAALPVGDTSAAQTVKVTNNSNAPLNVSGIAISNSQFAETDNCTPSVGAFGTCTISVTFTPAAGGSQTGTLTLDDGFTDTPISPQSVELIGIGNAASSPSPDATATPGSGPPPLPPTLSPLVLSLAAVPVGNTSAAQTVKVTNNSNGPLSVSGITISNSQFAETDNCTPSVGAFGTCTISVTFTPASGGSQTGTLTLDDGFTDTPISPQSVELIGVGDAGSAGSPSATGTPVSGGPPPLPPTLSPLVLSFAAVPVGDTSAAQTVKVTNNSNAPLNVSGIAISNSQFAKTDNCTPSVGAFGTCTISVTFTPAAGGSQTGTLTLDDGFTDTPISPQSVELIGIGDAASSPSPDATATPGSGPPPLPPTLSPLMLSFAAVPVGNTSAAQTVKVTNNSNAPLSVSGITISNSQFAETDNCTPSVGAFGTCTIGVTFTPAAGGSQTGTLTLDDGFTDTPISPQSVELIGIGIASPTPSVIATPGSDSSPSPASTATPNTTPPLPPTLSPLVLSFAALPVGDTSAAQTVKVTNNSNGPLSVSGITISNSQFAETDNCTPSVAAFGTCTIGVTFTPAAGGSQTGTLTLDDGFTDTPISPQSVELIGIGIASPTPSVIATPGSDSSPSPASTATPNTTPPLPPTLSPLVLSFAALPVGNTSAAQTVKVTNNSNGPLSVSGITISNGQFAETDNCTPSVAAFGTCTIGVTFTPAAGGSQTGTLTLNDGFTDTPISPQSVELIGIGDAGSSPSPDATATPGSGPPPLPPTLSPLVLSFAALPVGSTSATQTVKVTNNSNGPLNVSGIAISNSEFAETDNCTPSVAAFGTCTISVTFTPAAGGSQTGTLTLDDGFTDTPISPQSVELIGIGNAGSSPSPDATATPGSGPPPLPPTLSPLMLSFAAVPVGNTSAAQTVKVTNNSNGPLSVSGITISNGQFAETDNCTPSVGAFGTCTISVAFVPAATGLQLATLTVDDGFTNTPVSPQSVEMYGIGTAAVASPLPTPDPSPTPTPAAGLPPTLVPLVLWFGPAPMGTAGAPKSVSLTNNQNAPLPISGITISDSQFSETDNCVPTVAPFGHCTIVVTFAPAATGSQTGMLAVQDGFVANPLSPQSVELLGVGIVPSPTPTPAP